jgi:hypothetical protein
MAKKTIAALLAALMIMNSCKKDEVTPEKLKNNKLVKIATGPEDGPPKPPPPPVHP